MARKLTAQKREDLIRAAIKVFREKGYGEASVKEIVDEAGASTATFYRYFKTKDEIYVEIIMNFIAGFGDTWRNTYRMLSENGGDREDTLRMVAGGFRAILDYYRENRDVAQVVFRRIVPIDKRFEKQSEMLVDATMKQLEEIIGAIQSVGLAGNIEPRVGAAITIGAVFGVAVECVLQDERDDVDELVDQVMEVVTHGIADSP
ncbi:MAG: TetR/AcrR family transcriptional regulator [Actinobacteria bacterium]|nr:TetR/AcrR family transcriptional regulator [Actinomycetota bacterium]MCG2818322.1 TetR/AcrR family transcriptional regulator [Actinomycetes bacterium]MBU4179138.1 TetR/AcrR family transcriptional regulator [Actinomycetota bacterium]MBU4218438.1 TetR/AcrR family transcriptional regulator [Actinomycetota bacterium]MBU4358828.1 TetR/AcrR family transcriptional regulator [Actinomycetota bacterium]